MLKRLVSVAAVVVGLAAWVSRAHSAAPATVWGYLHFGVSGDGSGCTSCDPNTTPLVPHSMPKPYSVYYVPESSLWAPPEWCVEYVDSNGYWVYRIRTELMACQLLPGEAYYIMTYKSPYDYNYACTSYGCQYRVVFNGGNIRLDVKMHGRSEENPAGGDVGPGSYTNPCRPEGVKLAWVNGALRIRTEKPTELNLKLYDVSGKLILEKRVSVKAGESAVELPVKGLNVLVVKGEDFTKTLKIVK